MDPLVSIIIPVYNADESLLRSCLNSVVKQTYKNIEVVLIDDGSAEHLSKSYDELVKIDARIRVIHQPNQGVSAARNNGTLAAAGEYVMYVDGDDLLASIAVEEGVRHILNDGVDLVIAGVEKITSHEQFSDIKEAAEKFEILDSSGIEELRRHYLALDDEKFLNIRGNGYITRGPICRLIEKKSASEIRFPIGMPIGEDLIWNMDLLSACNKVCLVYNIWYGYLKQSGSAIRKYYGDRIERVEEYLNKLLADHGEFCNNNKDAFGKNAAVEFYCILRYELMDPRCRLSKSEKNKLVREMLKREPWIRLTDASCTKRLPGKHRILILLCKMSLWQPALSILYGKD